MIGWELKGPAYAQDPFVRFLRVHAVPRSSYDLTTDSTLQLDDKPTTISGYHNAQRDYLPTLL